MHINLTLKIFFFLNYMNIADILILWIFFYW